MKVDLYTRTLLTIIAVCLVLLTIRSTFPIREAKAAGPTACTGQLTANAYGGTQAMVGGYEVTLNCHYITYL